MIRVNDKWNVGWHQGMTVQDVLAARKFTHHHVAVSINGELVPPDEYSTRLVADGDQVQVIHIIGGG
ncbi:MAG: sulfur carrier protein ThiS [Anaerolineae bacterium]|jgi:sulfur carrier protein